MKSLVEIQKKSFLTIEDLVKLQEIVLSTGYMSGDRVLKEIEWFTVDLGIDEYYFKTTSIEDIAKHLLAISASALVSKYGGEGVGIQLMNERDDRAIYIVEDVSSKTDEIERRIEQRYSMYRVESYLTKKKAQGRLLRFYIVTKPEYQRGIEKKERLSFEDAANSAFLQRSEPGTIARYKEAWESMNNRQSPYIAVSEKTETNETRFMVGIHGEGARQFLSNFSHLLYKYNIHSKRKYRETFFDRKCINTFYFDRMDEETIEEFSRDLGSVVMLPQHPITQLFNDEIYSAQETMYAVSACVFTHQFLTVLTEEYLILNRALKDQPEAKGILDKIKMRLIKDTFSEVRITQAVIDHRDIVSLIYSYFVQKLHPRRAVQDLSGLEEEIRSKIYNDVPSQKNKTILNFMLGFNRQIIKTNFFMRDKTCMAFRLDPSFLDRVDFPESPYGLFFIVGRTFVGFHIRFRDIARGGIRIVKSRNLTAYENNLDTIFFENYSLASTQQKKNKDIPEGGSKGTILLFFGSQNEEEIAFKSYIDGIMDLIMPGEEVIDLHGKDEILFLGPDERTAELMNWAALYAKRRKYPFWKAFTTGKAPAIGGIPHDTYGMTTAGIHEYVLAILKKMGLKEEEITKLQTGGPDGDLGSNEILISKDRTIAVVDGSGVLYDPEGIDREELSRLVKQRVMTDEFNGKLISKRGFYVSVDDKELVLPDGSTIPNGEEFRNTFCLHPLAKADLFVPCGGRPASININNWKGLFDDNGRPKFRIIVEGANLFITEDARLRLEEHGIVLIKDASTNKGGVTSSSLEVFASLALSDDEYDGLMRVQEKSVSDFRKKYIEDIIATIRKNARMEFDLLWKEHETSGSPFTLLTNMVSLKINDITDAVAGSDLPGDRKIREKIVAEYSPKPLLDLVGIDGILKRVPDKYLDAIVATKIATGFVYKFGLDTTEVDFYNYVRAIS
ncbi:MAG TPA: NAD-glutamate dehydrogenase domain-containing protein [Spirochaetota bacterium]|nr:NAD-glutamate dehydrogenase domain-containing protein [Spirochaetota bacterium]